MIAACSTGGHAATRPATATTTTLSPEAAMAAWRTAHTGLPGRVFSAIDHDLDGTGCTDYNTPVTPGVDDPVGHDAMVAWIDLANVLDQLLLDCSKIVWEQHGLTSETNPQDATLPQRASDDLRVLFGDAVPTTTTSTTVKSFPSKPLTEFDDGFYDVGDVPGWITPGTYVVNGPVLNCYWVRRDFNGNVIDSHFGDSDGVTVTIAPTDALFESASCGHWTRQ
jgi:hypothetical protein